MKHNDEHKTKGESVFWVLSVVSRQSYGSFIFKYLRYIGPDPTRKEGSGPTPNLHLYQHPTDNWGVISGCGYDCHSSE